MEEKVKVKKPFYKKWWVWLIAVVVVIGFATGGDGEESVETAAQTDTDTASNVTESNNNNSSTEEPEEDPAEEEVVEESKEPTYTTGTYLVGEDIEPGLYRAKVTGFGGMSYIERASGVSMEFDDIIANIILSGDGYVEILSDDVAVKIQGAELIKVVYEELVPDIKTEVEDGIYLVGIDIEPGQYKVEVTDTISQMAYIERASRVAMGFEDIIANELFQGPGYVNISDSDFAVKVQGAKIIKQ